MQRVKIVSDDYHEVHVFGRDLDTIKPAWWRPGSGEIDSNGRLVRAPGERAWKKGHRVVSAGHPPCRRAPGGGATRRPDAPRNCHSSTRMSESIASRTTLLIHPHQWVQAGLHWSTATVEARLRFKFI